MEHARQQSLAQTANTAVVQRATICDGATGQGLFSSTATGRGKQR